MNNDEKQKALTTKIATIGNLSGVQDNAPLNIVSSNNPVLYTSKFVRNLMWQRTHNQINDERR